MTAAELLSGPAYLAYVYGYPHKTAYRTLTPALPLRQVWQNEPQDSLFLYLHVPFCEHRCGFCNLFTQAQPEEGIVARYLAQLRREAEQVRAALPDARFVRVAIGGGTPTFCEADELETLCEVASDVMGVDLRSVDVSCEASPATATRERLEVLRERGVDRISLGVQTFDDEESGQLGRPQRRGDVERALATMRELRFPVINVDLIYGGAGQTTDSWRHTLRQTLDWRPEEVYLYPLYVRPLTGLGRRAEPFEDNRLPLYRLGRELLLETGYKQASMRMFHLPQASQSVGPAYCCQADGMVGLGCGARSYTRELHYSTEYAVSRQGVRAILDDYLSRPTDDFSAARHGFRLDRSEQQRRYALLTLLQAEGLSRNGYLARFGEDVLTSLPELSSLLDAGLASLGDERLQLTASGLERSDAIGPWLFSANVRRLTEGYLWR